MSMSTTYKTQAGQGWYDIAIALTGIADNAQAIADANGMTLTDTIPSGTTVIVPDMESDVRVVNYYLAHPHPATDASQWPGDPIEQGGIGRMAIGTTFIID